MLYRINLYRILQDHHETTKMGDGKADVSYLLLLYVVPLVIVVSLFLNNSAITLKATSTWLSLYIFLTGFLLNMIALVYSIHLRLEEASGAIKKRPVKKKLVKEIFSSILYSILVCLLCIILLILLEEAIFPARTNSGYVTTYIFIYASLHFSVVLLTLIKKIHALISTS